MKTLYLSTIVILFSGSSLPAWASVDLNAYLPISGDPVTPEFKFSKSVTITYPAGGNLETLLDGQNKTISFTSDSDHDPQVDTLRRDINIQLSNGTHVTTQLSNLKLDYIATINGGPHSTRIEYSVTLIPTMTNYTISRETDVGATILDASWISFDEKQPVTIKTKYGGMEINYLTGLIKNQLPDVYGILKGTQAETALQQNLIDSSQILSLNPLDRWDSLFDPSYVLTKTAQEGLAGDKVAATTFSTGLDNFGIPEKIRHEGADFDASSHIDISEGRDVATINVQGHANSYNLHGKWAFATTLLPGRYSTCCPVQPWYENPVVWVAVVGAATAGFFVFYFRRFREE